jgi:anti-sigma regulatory factor (Ser/Thr protein kinase)
MQDLSLHILDVAENGIRAGAANISIMICEDGSQDTLTITIADDGRGMSPEFLERVLDPFVTTRTTRKVGLGLSLFQQTAESAEGNLEIESVLGQGTTIKVYMKLNHIDRKPMGNMAETMAALIQGNPNIDFSYMHVIDGKQFSFSTSELRPDLEEIPINHPEVVQLIRNIIAEGLRELSSPS